MTTPTPPAGAAAAGGVAAPPALLPARYKGHQAVRLAPTAAHGGVPLGGDGQPLRDATGAPRTWIESGDAVLVPASEVLGETWLRDRRQHRPAVFVGLGHVVRAEDAGLSADALDALGYDFDEGRADFELVGEAPAPPAGTVPLAEALAAAAAAAAVATPAPTAVDAPLTPAITDATPPAAPAPAPDSASDTTPSAPTRTTRAKATAPADASPAPDAAPAAPTPLGIGDGASGATK